MPTSLKTKKGNINSFSLRDKLFFEFVSENAASLVELPVGVLKKQNWKQKEEERRDIDWKKGREYFNQNKRQFLLESRKQIECQPVKLNLPYKTFHLVSFLLPCSTIHSSILP